MNQNRIKEIVKRAYRPGPVIYWMSRDQRIDYNWALAHALDLSIQKQQPLAVVFTLVPDYMEAGLRQYDFMLKGLKKVEENLKQLNIPFYILTGDPRKSIHDFIESKKVSFLITDFDPSVIKRIWKRDIARKANCTFLEIDTHNIVPVQEASNKSEVGAYTYRPKVQRLLKSSEEYFPILEVSKYPLDEERSFDFEEILLNLKVDQSVKPIVDILPGEDEAEKKMIDFIENKLENYEKDRNNPLIEGSSGLSPYLHYGQIASQKVYAEIMKRELEEKAEKFLDELIVRKELADNFCYYNNKYNTTEVFPDWAKLSLNQHREDKREFVYSLEQFEKSETHEDLWNACQTQMVKQGRLNGYLRMYWCKKILEWSATPEDAMNVAIHLNDKYQLDGRDPNGYTGIAWSIGGVHDRPWFDRPVYGKIRYMNRNGCTNKFDVEGYIKMVENL